MKMVENKKLKSDDVRIEESNNLTSAVLAIEPKLEHDIYISDKLSEKLDNVIIEIKEKAKLGYLAGNGAILSGFQGTGKTMLVKKLANDLGAKIIVIDKDMLPKQISASFETARNMAKEGKNVLVIIDEVDAFGQKEYARFGTGYSKLTTLMTELDGINTEKDLKGLMYVFATTNYLESVDDRLIRPGRLEELIEVPLPDAKARKAILSIHKKNNELNPHEFSIPEEVVDYLSKKTNGYTPADLRSLIKHCCIEATKRADKKVDISDAQKALNEFIVSLKRGLDFFTEPKFCAEDVIGRQEYMLFLTEWLKKENEAKFLLYGPKGTSKSMLPEVLANLLCYNFVYVRGSELQEGIVGEGTKKIKKMFQRAQMAAPCVVLIDELEGMVTETGTISHKDDETAYINSLLARPLQGVYLFATTNNPLKINTTTLSRFVKIYNELPNEKERYSYFEKKLEHSINGSAGLLAKKTDGYSFRDLENIVKAVNRIEEKTKACSNKSDILDCIIAKYVPENKDANLNWNAIRSNVGDVLEVEKFVYSIMDKGTK